MASSILKYVFFFFTFALWLVAFSGFVVGIWAAVDPKFVANIEELQIPNIDGNLLKTSSIVLIVTSLIVSIVAFFGCFGAYKEKRRLLFAYGGVTSLFLVLFVVVLVLAFVKRNWIRETIETTAEDIRDNWAGKEKFWREFQRDNRCCFWKNETLAETYCGDVTASIVATQVTPATPPPRLQLCADVIFDIVDEQLRRHKPKIVGVAVAAFIGILATIVSSCVLARSFGDS